ncbi:MAG: hypothetical protein IKS10_03345 [Lachnospiraceae bacterium]|nr:hypothetical protein [Lachnospiraceae bacterium]
MGEKLYRSLTASGAANIAVGIIIIVAGVATGVVAIVNGARMLINRKTITF